jgi:uncharacterized protein (DUF433 family)
MELGPTIRDTGITVDAVAALHEAGYPPHWIAAALPVLTAEDIAAAFEWWAEFREEKPRIVTDPAIQGGCPVFRGTRIPVDTVIAMLDRGCGPDEIIEAYPTLTIADLDAAVDVMRY